jgi:ribonuclease Z
MAEIAILGSGSGFPTRDRFCTSVALMVEPALYLFDCGEPASALLRRAGIDAGALRAVFLSHMHSDHVSGLPQLVSAVSLPARGNVARFKPWSVSSTDPWYREGLSFPAGTLPAGRRKVEIVMPSSGIDAVRNFLDAVFLAPAQLPFDLIFTPVRQGLAYDDGVVRLTAAANDHLNANPSYRDMPADRRQSYSCRADVAGRTVVFSGDVNRPEDLAPLLKGRVDLLIMEVAHYDPSGLRDFLAGFAVDRVVLSHIHPGLEERIAGLVQAWGDDRITIARDGMRLPLGRADNGTQP